MRKPKLDREHQRSTGQGDSLPVQRCDLAERLVSYRKEGRQVFYRLHDHHVLELYQTVREHLAQ